MAARSYRELSVKHHPDKRLAFRDLLNAYSHIASFIAELLRSSSSGQRFQRLREAYEILDDPIKLLLRLGPWLFSSEPHEVRHWRFRAVEAVARPRGGQSSHSRPPR